MREERGSQQNRRREPVTCKGPRQKQAWAVFTVSSPCLEHKKQEVEVESGKGGFPGGHGGPT